MTVVTEPRIDTSDGVITRKRVYLDDLDGFGMLYHATYARLLDDAVIDFWQDAGWRIDPATQILVIRELNITYHQPIVGICDVDVHFWVEKAGRTSVTYNFEILSTDHTVRHAEGTRVIVNLDGQSWRPTPLTEEMWAMAQPLLARGFVRPAA